MVDIPKRIAVSGAKGYLGGATLAALASMSEPPDLLMGIDLEPVAAPEGYTGEFISVSDRDISKPIDDILGDSGVDCFMHLAFQMPGRRDASTAHATNVESTRATLESCAKTEATKYVYTSSATVYGAHEDFSHPYTEEDPPRPIAGFNYSEDKVKAERIISDFSESNHEISTCVLRICMVVGEGDGNFMESLLYTPLIPADFNANPPIQFLHIKDYKTLITKVVKHDTSGVFNVAGTGTIPWKDVAPVLGSYSLPLPSMLMNVGTDIAWNFSLQKISQSAGVDLIRWPWIVSTEKVEKTFDWEPASNARQSLELWAESKDSDRTIFDVLKKTN